MFADMDMNPFGTSMSTWNSNVDELIASRGLLDRLDESDEDARLPYFANRTITSGLRSGTLADLALVICYNNGELLGEATMSYAMKAFAYASGVCVDWNSVIAGIAFARLREMAD